MRKVKLMAASSAIALLAAGSAYAADPVEREGMSLVVYGLVNQLIMYGEDNNGNDGVFMPTHHSIPSRVGFKAKGNINDDLQLGAKIEFSLSEARAGSVTWTNQGAGSGGFQELRHAYWWLKSSSLGQLTVGHANLATNGIAEIDLTGTANPALGAGVWNLGRGLMAGTGNRMDTFDGGDNGGGGRNNVVRYDTPSFAGFKLAASVTDDNDRSIALRYARSFGDIKIAAGIGHDDHGFTSNVDRSQTSTSGTIKHSSGLSLYGAYGHVENAGNGDRDSYIIKLGYSASLNEYGGTHFAIDYGESDYQNSNDDPENWGVTLVQDISHLGAKFYVGYRNMENNATDIDVIYAGAAVKF